MKMDAICGCDHSFLIIPPYMYVLLLLLLYVVPNVGLGVPLNSLESLAYGFYSCMKAVSNVEHPIPQCWLEASKFILDGHIHWRFCH